MTDEPLKHRLDYAPAPTAEARWRLLVALAVGGPAGAGVGWTAYEMGFGALPFLGMFTPLTAAALFALTRRYGIVIGSAFVAGVMAALLVQAAMFDASIGRPFDRRSMGSFACVAFGVIVLTTMGYAIVFGVRRSLTSSATVSGNGKASVET